jgi:hypothetical protein
MSSRRERDSDGRRGEGARGGRTREGDWERPQACPERCVVGLGGLHPRLGDRPVRLTESNVG